ncbi:MAG: hypothetical protein KDI55_22450, partial [Anaerolineae bacterium]|nr:hypothetical protein [Anaerolineae bacterium]
MTMQKRGGVPAQRMLAAAGFVLTGLVAAGPAWCESGLHGFNRSLDDDYSLAVGAYLADVNSRYQTVTRSGIASAYIDMERLGLAENETQPFLSAKARLNDRWRIDLHAFGTDRSGTRTADHDIDLGEAGTIPINARVDTTFRAAIYAIRAGYSFVRTQ